MNRILRGVTVAAVIVGAGLGLTACGSSGPATEIEFSGSYEVGAAGDIAPGVWKITAGKGTVADPCTYSIFSGDRLIGASGSRKEQATRDGKFASLYANAPTLKTGAEGLPMVEGWTFITDGCGTWTRQVTS